MLFHAGSKMFLDTFAIHQYHLLLLTGLPDRALRPPRADISKTLLVGQQ